MLTDVILLPATTVQTGVTLCLAAHTGNNVQCADGAGKARCDNPNRLLWEHMRLKQVSAQHFVLTSMRTGNNLQCRADGSMSFANKNEGLWEKFALEQDGESLFFISAHTGKVMQCTRSGELRCHNQNRRAWSCA